MRSAGEPATAASIGGWRDAFVAGCQAAVRSRPADKRNEKVARPRVKIRRITVANELS
jgi:hypothetical protein